MTAFKGLWAGYDDEVLGASRIIPFTRVGDDIDFYPTVVCDTVRFKDRMPLLDEAEGDSQNQKTLDQHHLTQNQKTTMSQATRHSKWK